MKEAEFPVLEPEHRYDWDLILDGTSRLFEPFEDFTCTPRSFQVQVINAGRLRGVKVRTARRSEGVYVQANPPPAWPMEEGG